MRSIMFAALGAAVVSTAPAAARGFEFDLAEPVSAPIGAVHVVVSPDIIERQTTARGTSSRQLETIGPRDAERVSAILDRAIKGELRQAGVLTDTASDGDLTLNVTVTKVRATDLRFTEFGIVNNLRFGSIALGGAAFDAELVNADGDPVGTFAYSWFETQLEPQFATGSTWSDARRSARRFGDRVGDTLVANTAIN